ncbi:MAG: tetratricopeptide repeat protein, partial [Candidatus Eisenbacteria bacterium]
HEALAELHARLGDDRAAGRHLRLARTCAIGGQFRGDGVEIPGETHELMRVAALYDAGRFGEALAAFEGLRARAEEEGNRPLALRLQNNVGLCLYRLGRLEEAEAEYRALLDEDPAYIKGYTNLAKVRAARGETEDAKALYGEALRLDPDNPRIRADLEKLDREAGGGG